MLLPTLRRAFISPAPTSRLLMTSNSATPGPVEQSIRHKLVALLEPSSISITNDSWQHRHHAPMRTETNNGETHFSIQVVSDRFEGKNTMQRHRMIYSALAKEFEQGLTRCR
ncbi:bola-like protein-domain-containing protein [Cyathus striatus]|nr:bola-like protein-domain-containing protein [Cyathus striatus]